MLVLNIGGINRRKCALSSPGSEQKEHVLGETGVSGAEGSWAKTRRGWKYTLAQNLGPVVCRAFLTLFGRTDFTLTGTGIFKGEIKLKALF